MNTAILSACTRRDGAAEEALAGVEAALGARLPSDYRQFLLERDGAEGPIGETAYIALWSVGELVSLNRGYNVSTFIPGITLIGGDGGGTGYGFRRNDDHFEYVDVPLVGMDLDEVRVLGTTFAEMLQRIASE